LNAKPHTKLTDTVCTQLRDVGVILESRHEINLVSGIITAADYNDAQRFTIKDIWVYGFSKSSISKSLVLFQLNMLAPINYCQLYTVFEIGHPPCNR